MSSVHGLSVHVVTVSNTTSDVSVTAVTWVTRQCKFLFVMTSSLLTAMKSRIKVFQGDILECRKLETAL